MNFLDIKSTNIRSYKKKYKLHSISFANASPQETRNHSPEVRGEDQKLACAGIIRLWHGYWNGQWHLWTQVKGSTWVRKGFNSQGSIPDVLSEAWAHSEALRGTLCPGEGFRDGLAGWDSCSHLLWENTFAILMPVSYSLKWGCESTTAIFAN